MFENETYAIRECPRCARTTLHARPALNVPLHIAALTLTAFLWLPVMAVSMWLSRSRPDRCLTCRSENPTTRAA